MKKTFWMLSFVCGFLFLISGCHNPSQQNQDPVPAQQNQDPVPALYEPVEKEILENLEVCKIDPGAKFAFDNSRHWPEDVMYYYVRDAINNYDKITSALAQNGITIEYMNDPNLPIGCRWSEQVQRYGLGTSTFISYLKSSVIDPDGTPSKDFMKYKTKVDVIRVLISSIASSALIPPSSFNDKNVQDPSKFVMEIDAKTGTPKRVFTVYVNPAYPFVMTGAGTIGLIFDND